MGCASAFLTISGESCNITVGTFHGAPRLARKAALPARRTASSAAATRQFCRRRRRGATGLRL